MENTGFIWIWCYTITCQFSSGCGTLERVVEKSTTVTPTKIPSQQTSIHWEKSRSRMTMNISSEVRVGPCPGLQVTRHKWRTELSAWSLSWLEQKMIAFLNTTPPKIILNTGFKQKLQISQCAHLLILCMILIWKDIIYRWFINLES